MALGRPKNQLGTVIIKIAATKAIADDLERIVATGYFGKHRNQAAERILGEGLRRAIVDESVILKARKRPKK